MNVDYYQLEGFENLYIEDSYVLSIETKNIDKKLIFSMEFVLNESHPLYESPKVGEQYCYRLGQIVFSDVEKILWLSKNLQAIYDPCGSIDYGNIDSFLLTEEGYYLIGEWGELKVLAESVMVNFEKK